MELIGLLKGKDVMIGCIDVASDVVETPQEVADTIRAALDTVSPERLYPGANGADGVGNRLRQARGARGGRRTCPQGRSVAPLRPLSHRERGRGEGSIPSPMGEGQG